MNPTPVKAPRARRPEARHLEARHPKARRPGALATALLLVLAAGGLGACAGDGDDRPEPVTSAESLYRSAKGSLNRGDFLSAIDTFETLGARFPFGIYTQQAQLDIAYAYLKQEEFDNAIGAADRFIKLYPQSEDIDYALYMKGLADYSRGGSAFERFFPRDMSRVNQQWLRSSYAEFDTLIRRFPESEYAPDALERMRFLKGQMARHELITARFYHDRGAMIAAVNRVTYLLDHFDGTPEVPDALALMASAYRSLGQKDLERDTLRVLAATDPGHPALEGSKL